MVLVLWGIVLTNCLFNALVMSLGLLYVLLNVMELLSCCFGRLCARPWFLDVFPPDYLSCLCL